MNDLKQRGLFHDTLIALCGEFGRTHMAQGTVPDLMGRDHRGKGCSTWMPGGWSFGAADDLGSNAAEDATDVRDLHPAILHRTGIDHTVLTYRFHACDFRLRDIHGKVVSGILAQIEEFLARDVYQSAPAVRAYEQGMD